MPGPGLPKRHQKDKVYFNKAVKVFLSKNCSNNFLSVICYLLNLINSFYNPLTKENKKKFDKNVWRPCSYRMRGSDITRLQEYIDTAMLATQWVWTVATAGHGL